MSIAGNIVCRSEWDEFLATSRPDVGFKQSTWWAEFLSVRKWGHFGVVVRDGSEIVGGAIVLKRRFASGRCYYYLPQGPVLPVNETDAQAVFEAILSEIDLRRREDSRTVSHLRIEPRWTTRPSFVEGFREGSGWLEPRSTLCIDLAAPEEAILAQMKPKGRYNIRVAMRSGVSVVEDVTSTGLHDFYTLYQETISRHERSPYSIEYFQALVERLIEGDCGTLLFAEYQGRRRATALIIDHGDTSSYKYGGSSPEYRSVMAPYLLHFEAIRRAQTRGLRWYDFCGIARTEDPNDDFAGFSAFKRKFGGEERHFIPPLELVYDEGAYEEYQRR
jgi:lipid II:glycine glycyltransferase (peptidoglycan interpeptide bridge formation enzyme)